MYRAERGLAPRLLSISDRLKVVAVCALCRRWRPKQFFREPLRAGESAKAANPILAHYRSGNDDALVLVVRLTGISHGDGKLTNSRDGKSWALHSPAWTGAALNL